MMSDARYSRQSFLGPASEERIARCVVGVVGLGGGGSHIVQQLAHIGFQRFVLYDGDAVDTSNLNRLIGAGEVDAKARTPKLHLAKLMIWGLQPGAEIQGYAGRWQDYPEPLRRCHLVFGCVDTYAGRNELESSARRYLINYIDIGMDVHQVGETAPVMGGQVILSMPGGPCMWCLGFLTQERLGEEAALYGATGGRPQVVWPNGILASTAVGLGMELVTGWNRTSREYAYLSYDGNRGTVQPHWRTRNLEAQPCSHYPLERVGEPVFTSL